MRYYDAIAIGKNATTGMMDPIDCRFVIGLAIIGNRPRKRGVASFEEATLKPSLAVRPDR